MSDDLALTRPAVAPMPVHLIDGERLAETPLPGNGVLLAHALSAVQRARCGAGRIFAFSASARLTPGQLAPLQAAAAAHAGEQGELPETALGSAIPILRDALQRALEGHDLAVTITAASRRFGVCLVLSGDADGDTAWLNPAGLGLGVWSLRCQQQATVPLLGLDARAAPDLDYRRDHGEQDLAAISVVCGERSIEGMPAWLALTARSGALADPATAAASHAMLEAMLRALTDEVVPAGEARRTRLFRAEALAAQDESPRQLPLHLLLAPRWTARLVRLLLVGTMLLLALLFVPVQDRLGATARLGINGLTPINANAAGRITAVAVAPGQHVLADTALLELTDSSAAAAAERAFAEYLGLLRQRLAHTDAAAADPALGQAWERLRQARTAAQPWLRAPSAGRILDLQTGTGQAVAAGTQLLLFEPDDAAPVLDLYLPARAASRLPPGSSGSVRLASLPGREFAIRLVWVAATLATVPGENTPQLHARAVFVGPPPPALPGSSAEVRIELGTVPLFALLYQRLRGN